MIDVKKLTALELSNAVKAKEISVCDAVTLYLDIAEKNAHNAWITVIREEALAKALDIQKRIDLGEFKDSPLAGVPIGIKDNISTKGTLTTCASKMLGNYKPVFNATVIEKIEMAGMIIIGKLNMDEFAMGGSSETSAFGAVRNPSDLARVAGGSSGGSAAAVAAFEVPLALGSDTGGSIRQPCGFCGAVGIKPTYGLVSRYGLVAFASSLDQIGPVGRNTADTAALLDVISGYDKKDSTSLKNEQTAPIDRPLRIGLPKNYFAQGLDGEVKQAVLNAAKTFEDLGAAVEEFDMPLTQEAIHAYYVIACAEASSNLSRYDGLKYGYRSENAANLSDIYRLSRSEGFGLEVKRRIMLGSFVLSSGYYDAYYKKASDARTLIKNIYENLFKKYDIILAPTAPTLPYKIGENIDDPIKMYMGDVFTVSVNLAGLPAIALPCPLQNSLPIGFQLIGDKLSEKTLIQAAQMFENTSKKAGV